MRSIENDEWNNVLRFDSSRNTPLRHEAAFLIMRQTETNGEAQVISLNLAVTFAWSTFKKHSHLFTKVLLTLVAAWAGLEVAVIAGQRLGILWWLIAHLTFLVFFASVELGLLRVCLAYHDGKEPTFAAAFADLASGAKFLAAQVLYVLVVAIGLLVLVVPGLYASVRYGLFGFCMAAGETGPVVSFRYSARLTAGSRMRLLGIFMALFLFNLVGAAVLGVGLLITLPVSSLTLAALYGQLHTLQTRELPSH